MLKHVVAATALAAVIASPAFAQSSPTTTPSSSMPSTSASPAPGSNAGNSGASVDQGAFLQDQPSSDWRASKLIGTNVYGPDNAKIGDVSDVLLDNSGSTHAVVIGVGGFLGVGQKDVAVPFNSLTVTPTAAGDKIEKITVKYTKADLEKAPAFKYRQASTASNSPAGAPSGGMAPERSGANTPAR